LNPPQSASLQRTLANQIADQLAIEIIEECLAPGERLNETLLSERFGVSRAPLREALRILEKRSLVTITPQRGARVRTLSAAEVDHLFEIRTVLVGLSGRLAALNRDAEKLDALERCLAALETACADPDGYARASAASTLEVARASGNPKLLEMIESFAQQIGRYARIGLSTQARRDRSLGNWHSLVAAIRARDGDLAELMQRTLAAENRKAAIEMLRSRGLPPTHTPFNEETTP
jgi:DNA-binding GntR family transcriptional regulator